MLECLLPLFASEGLVAEVLELKRASGDGRGHVVVAKLADFGLARIAPELARDSVSHVSTQTVAGTLPYMPPEFVMSRRVSTKTDAFAFGVVLLELLASQRDGEVPAVQNGGGGGPLDEFADAAAQGGWPEDVAREVIELAAACVRPNARRRKSADIIARALKQIARDEVDEAGNVVTLMRLADKACGTARDQSGELPRFDKMRARERARFEFAALKLQARWRGP